MKKLEAALFVFFFPLSLALLPIAAKARKLAAAETECFSRPSVECAGCPDFGYVFRKRACRRCST